LSDFARQVELFDKGTGNAADIFAIGKALRGHVNEEKRTIFNDESHFHTRIGPAKQAVAFYEKQISSCKAAVHAWTLVGKAYGVVKDIRILIGKLIWETRGESLYK